MISLVIAGVITIFIAAFAYDMYGSPQFVPAPPVEDEKVLVANKSLGLVPDFSIKTIDGREVSITDFRGRVVILNFWATWCSTCVVEMPDILDLVDGFGGSVVFLAISSDTKLEHIARFINGSDKRVQDLFKSEDVYVSLDSNGAITRDIFMTQRYPETIIIAPNGGMVRKIVGEFEWSGSEIKIYLRQMEERMGFEPT